MQDRIKHYFTKIQNVENPPSKYPYGIPPESLTRFNITERTTELDKAAASRFIKHAISEAQLQQQQWKKTRAEEDQGDDETSEIDGSPKPTTIKQHKVPPKTTSKMLARQEYEKELRGQNADANTDDEDVLGVFDQNVRSMDVDDSPLGVNDKGKGKEESTSMRSPGVAPSKRRRPAIDPFSASGKYELVFRKSTYQMQKIGFVGDDHDDEEPVLSSSSRRRPKSAKTDLPPSEAKIQPSQSGSHSENKVKKKRKKNKNSPK